MLSPREVFEELVRGIAEGRWDELANRYAEDTVVEHPFALPVPTRIEGRAGIRRHFSRALPLEFLKAEVTAVHETADPEVIVAEYDYDLRAKPTGREFRVANIQVLRVRDGLIVASRDFRNHAAVAAAITQ
jgi:uncharacterized protein